MGALMIVPCRPALRLRNGVARVSGGRGVRHLAGSRLMLRTVRAHRRSGDDTGR